jgi:hypothetical protein
MRFVSGIPLIATTFLGVTGNLFDARPVAATAFAGQVSNAIRIASEDFVARYCSGRYACLAKYRVAFAHAPHSDKIFFFSGTRPPETKAELRADLTIGPNVDYTISSAGKLVDRYVEE